MISFPLVIIIFIVMALTLASSSVPLIIGKVKKHRVIKPVEYVPPRGASPIDILIQYYGSSAQPREMFNPLMLYWAERGFITIEEDCKRGLKLTKLKDIQRPESNDGFNPETYKIEEELFNFIFSGRRNTFYTLTARKTFKEFYEKLTDACKKQANKISAAKSRKFSVISTVMTFAMLLFVVIAVGVAINNSIIIAYVFPFAAIAVPKFMLSLPVSPENDGMPKGSAARFLMVPFFCMFGGIPFLLILSFLDLGCNIILITATVLAILNFYFLIGAIDIRDDEQLKFYARISGFKHFLLFAEVSMLEMMVEEDPRYFYNVLPYCYILKMTKKLKPKFDVIALDGPAWHLGELRDTLMF